LLSFREEDRLTRSLLKKKLEEYLADDVSIRMVDLDEALEEMASEGLLVKQDGNFKLTRRGIRLGREWKITNFSSFMLGGKTEDMANMLTLKALIDHSLSDIPDEKERMRSLRLAKHLFVILRREITKSNLLSASLCSVTTFLAGIMPIIAFLSLPKTLNIITSLGIIGVMTTVFLVRYRAKKAQVSWKVILPETIVIIAIATIISLIIGSGL